MRPLLRSAIRGAMEFRDRKTERLCGLIMDIHPRIFRLLVVGCGSGIEAAILAQRLDADVTGIDVSDRFNSEAAAVADLRVGDATRLDFPDRHFDFVYSFHAIEHVDRPGLAISEMARVMKADGGYWIGTPNRSRLFGYLGSKSATLGQKLRWNVNDWRARMKGRFRNELGAHAGFTRQELHELLAAALPSPEDQTLTYYRLIYPSWTATLGLLHRARIDRVAFPCIYFSGRGI